MPTKVLKDIKSMDLDTYVDQMIRRAPAERVSEGTCFNPSARCYVTNKRVFLKPVVRVKVIYLAQDEFLVSENMYFTPKQYTLFLLKGN